MTLKKTCLAILLAAAAVPAAAAGDVVSFSGDTAVVFGDDGKPVVRGTKDYVLELVGNPEGRVFGYDAERRMVRLSPTDKTGYWVSCKELTASGETCAAPAATPSRRPSRGGGGGADLPSQSAIPSCPGDPLCPRTR